MGQDLGLYVLLGSDKDSVSCLGPQTMRTLRLLASAWTLRGQNM